MRTLKFFSKFLSFLALATVVVSSVSEAQRRPYPPRPRPPYPRPVPQPPISMPVQPTPFEETVQIHREFAGINNLDLDRIFALNRRHFRQTISEFVVIASSRYGRGQLALNINGRYQGGTTLGTYIQTVNLPVFGREPISSYSSYVLELRGNIRIEQIIVRFESRFVGLIPVNIVVSGSEQLSVNRILNLGPQEHGFNSLVVRGRSMEYGYGLATVQLIVNHRAVSPPMTLDQYSREVHLPFYGQIWGEIGLLVRGHAHIEALGLQ